ncbi:alpha/beta hydrolase [bacterium]|nr:MAG: alpha/beta hydrolase [bacterium]
MDKDLFSVNFKGTKLIGDFISSGSGSRVMCLHGAGPANRQRFKKLRRLLADKNIASCAFDFIGHGDTGGNLSLSSLKSRVEQSLAVIKSQSIPHPLSIIASSMSGYVAIELTKFCEVKNLVFLAPAVYASKAHSLFFGPEFTKAIREPFSWRDSDVWEVLKHYKGNLLIFAAEKDQVIPDEVIEKIYNSAQNAKSREIIMIKGATHPLGKWLNEHPARLREVSDKICKILLLPRL